jgi:hypothetical protein
VRNGSVGLEDGVVAEVVEQRRRTGVDEHH